MVCEDRRWGLEKELEDPRPTYDLTSDSVVNNILRYEAAAEKEFDWALRSSLNLSRGDGRPRRQRAFSFQATSTLSSQNQARPNKG